MSTERADKVLRQQLVALLRGGNAHMPFDQAIADFPMEHINTRPPEVPYTFWHLLEHIRIAQWDILDFIHNTNYKPLKWPEGYWPDPETEADPDEWVKTINTFRADLNALVTLAENPATDLTAELPHAAGYTVLREILVVADHNAYHIGEFAILRQVMGLWPGQS
ncbi:MAG: DinB family protein [Chloroflexi bacterium]|nr:DinB family protein [Chloroflexota bacterium]